MFESRNFILEDSEINKHLKDDQKKGKLIDCMKTSVQMDLSIGSKDSKDFLELAAKANEKMFQTNITYLIDYKYQQMFAYIYVYRSLHFCFFAMNIAYAYSNTHGLHIALAIISQLLLIHEIINICAHGQEYFSSWKNVFDVVGIAVITVVYASDFLGIDL